MKIIKNKSETDFNNLTLELKKWLSFDCNPYYYNFNGPTKGLKPCIIAEEYIEQLDGQLYDYKFFCFNGQPKLIRVIIDRFLGEKSKRSLFDLNWNKLPVKYNRHPQINKNIEKPKHFNEMLEIAEKLSAPFPFVRVDFYEVNDKVYVGELTFTPAGGFGKYEPLEWDYKLGEMLDIQYL